MFEVCYTVRGLRNKYRIILIDTRPDEPPIGAFAASLFRARCHRTAY